jgi:hypothetical protein
VQSAAGVCVCVCLCVCVCEEAAPTTKRKDPSGNYRQLADALFIYFRIIYLFYSLRQLKPALAYAMLLVIVGGVGLACVKEGKGRCPLPPHLTPLVCPPPCTLLLASTSWARRIKKTKKSAITRHVLPKCRRDCVVV